MSTSFSKGIFALTLAGCCVAGPVSADNEDIGNSDDDYATVLADDEHEVLIIDGAYFPPLIYADIGDKLIFVNSSSDVHTVQAPEEEWTSGPIPIDGSFTLVLAAETPLTFEASTETEGSSAEDGDVILEQIGEITFEPEPVEG
jgi:plastocyanin